MRFLLTVCSSYFILMHVGPNHVVGAEFVPLGFRTGIGIFQNHMAVAEDGSIVLGMDLRPFPEVSESVRWTPESGLESRVASGVSASADGAITAGTSNDGHPFVAFEDELRQLPLPVGISRVNDIEISPDGRVVFALPDGVGRVLRWDTSDLTQSPQLIGFSDTLSGIQEVSGDGRTFVGGSSRWIEGEGQQALPLPAENSGEIQLVGLSTDARWAVGRIKHSELGKTSHQGARWDGFSAPDLLMAAVPDWGTVGIDVTADGTMVVGRLYLTDERLDRDADIAAGIWTEDAGRMMPLQDVLVSHFGLEQGLEGYHLTGVYEVTDDGRYMVGHMVGPEWEEGGGEAFFVNLGLRGDFNNDELLDVNDLNELGVAIKGNAQDLRFDLDYSSTVDSTDQRIWVKKLRKTYFGDANLDGEFNSGDLVTVFRAGQYEDNLVGNSGWATGDWNGDAEFDTSDLVWAFQDGGYEQGPRSNTVAIPEPSSAWVLLSGVLLLTCRRRKP